MIKTTTTPFHLRGRYASTTSKHTQHQGCDLENYGGDFCEYNAREICLRSRRRPCDCVFLSCAILSTKIQSMLCKCMLQTVSVLQGDRLQRRCEELNHYRPFSNDLRKLSFELSTGRMCTPAGTRNTTAPQDNHLPVANFILGELHWLGFLASPRRPRECYASTSRAIICPWQTSLGGSQ